MDGGIPAGQRPLLAPIDEPIKWDDNGLLSSYRHRQIMEALDCVKHPPGIP
jgi:hypothetical protein